MSITRPIFPLDVDIIDAIEDERARQGLSKRSFSLKAGMDESYWKKTLKDRNSPTFDTVERLAAALGKSVHDFLTPKSGSSLLLPSALESILIHGAAQAGAWVEAVEWAPDQRVSIQVPPDKRYKTVRRFAILVRGDSMDELYGEGSVVVCVRLSDVGRGPQHGDKVVCARHDGHAYEVTIKEYRERDGDRWLVPRSKNPQHNAIKLTPGSANFDIFALVTGRYENE